VVGLPTWHLLCSIRGVITVISLPFEVFTLTIP
jgi:hypothetical protein